MDFYFMALNVICFNNASVNYECFIGQDGNIIIQQDQDFLVSVIIPKEEWNEVKEFIDKQLDKNANS